MADRDERGRFIAGNKVGQGRPAHKLRIRDAIIAAGDELTEEGIAKHEVVARVLIDKAMAGEPWAQKLYYERVLGYPHRSVDVAASVTYNDDYEEALERVIGTAVD